jgi:aspartate ammonia-lyase
MVRLTDAGRRALQDAAPGHVDTVRRSFVDLMSRDEQRVLEAVAVRVQEHLARTDDHDPCDG